jgi:hypothetical protein
MSEETEMPELDEGVEKLSDHLNVMMDVIYNATTEEVASFVAEVLRMK